MENNLGNLSSKFSGAILCERGHGNSGTSHLSAAGNLPMLMLLITHLGMDGSAQSL
jgi:hypothetical protein